MNNQLQDINKLHSNSNFIERLATLDGNNNGVPNPKFFNEQPYVYVLSVSNWISSIEKNRKVLKTIKKAILNPPPAYWLENVEMSLDDFYEEKIQLFVIAVTSSVDGILNLINEIYLSPFKGRDINSKNLKRISRNDTINKIIDQMMNSTREIRLKRNSLVHSLESPHINILSEIRRMRLVIANFKMPKSNLIYNYDEGIIFFIDELDKYYNIFGVHYDETCNSLLSEYKKNIETFGGIKEPNHIEIELAKTVIQYFDGGEKPLHW